MSGRQSSFFSNELSWEFFKAGDPNRKDQGDRSVSLRPLFLPHAGSLARPAWEKWVPQTVRDPLPEECRPASLFTETAEEEDGAGSTGTSPSRLPTLSVPPAMHSPRGGQMSSGDFCRQEGSVHFLQSLW